ncbi:hypothetical protein PR048_008186 [Dryococelus australis]|uniref:Uncharacterized protein n=1 Tax=Dryococelus australis TaxID=614101 RepID=A0ABQ9HWD7_9NEOP|nr:hypothetical protein PR048_008186 [Dryococelus australis]
MCGTRPLIFPNTTHCIRDITYLLLTLRISDGREHKKRRGRERERRGEVVKKALGRGGTSGRGRQVERRGETDAAHVTSTFLTLCTPTPRATKLYTRRHHRHPIPRADGLGCPRHLFLDLDSCPGKLRSDKHCASVHAKWDGLPWEPLSKVKKQGSDTGSGWNRPRDAQRCQRIPLWTREAGESRVSSFIDIQVRSLVIQRDGIPMATNNSKLLLTANDNMITPDMTKGVGNRKCVCTSTSWRCLLTKAAARRRGRGPCSLFAGATLVPCTHANHKRRRSRFQIRTAKFAKFGLGSLADLVYVIRVWGRGDAVVRLLASQIDEPGSIPCGNRAGRCCWSADFLFLPPLHSSAAPYSPRFTLIGSQDLDVESRPQKYGCRLFTFYVARLKRRKANVSDATRRLSPVARPRQMKACYSKSESLRQVASIALSEHSSEGDAAAIGEAKLGSGRVKATSRRVVDEKTAHRGDAASDGEFTYTLQPPKRVDSHNVGWRLNPQQLVEFRGVRVGEDAHHVEVADPRPVRGRTSPVGDVPLHQSPPPATVPWRMGWGGDSLNLPLNPQESCVCRAVISPGLHSRKTRGLRKEQEGKSGKEWKRWSGLLEVTYFILARRGSYRLRPFSHGADEAFKYGRSFHPRRVKTCISSHGQNMCRRPYLPGNLALITVVRRGVAESALGWVTIRRTLQ